MSISFKASVIGNGVRLSSLTSDRVPRKQERRSIVTALQTDGHATQESRRNFLSGLIGAVGAGLAVQGAAEASYYSDLLEASKKPDTTQLLKAYEKTKKSEPKLKTKKFKSVNNKETLKRLPTIKQGNASSNGFGATGFVVGGLGVAGAAVLGQSASRKKESTKLSSRPRTAVKKPVNQPSQVRKPRPVAKPQGTMKKPAFKPASSGTVRLAPKSTGTMVKPVKKGSPTQRGGDVERSEKQSVLGPAAFGLGLVSIFAAYLLAFPNTAPRQEKNETPKEEISQTTSTVVETPKMEPAPVQNEMNEVTASKSQQPPDVSSKAQSSDSGVSKSKLPPTTGNSPVVLVGGSIVALVVAAAVGASPTTQESSTVTSTSAEGTPESRAAEARAWIEAWKKKQ
eukprot:jgi/Picsp_1/5757/NSC_03116-R1_---NA---